jgi:hypothetical protein
MKKFLVVLAGIAMFAVPAVNAQGRPFRLFFSTVGLTDTGNTNSPAGDPTASLGVNPQIDVAPNTPVRLYVWGQINPPGTPNNATYNGVSYRVLASGTGGSISGFNFWNYTNGSYGNGTGRWQQFSQSGDATSATFAGAAVVTGAGVNNTAAAVAMDGQHKRFATNGTTRIDATLLGWVEAQGSAIGEMVELRFAVGSSGIAQSGQPPQRIYMGWGDEASAPLGNEFGASTPGFDAKLNIIPEPASLMLLGLAGLAFRRR